MQYSVLPDGAPLCMPVDLPLTAVTYHTQEAARVMSDMRLQLYVPAEHVPTRRSTSVHAS